MTATIPPPIPVPSTARQSGWRWASSILLVLDLMLLGWLVLWALPAVPKYRDHFAEMGMEVPSLTKLVISIPQMAYYVASVAILLGIVAKEFLPNKKITTALNGIAILVILLLAMFILAGIALPKLLWQGPSTVG